MAKASGPPLKVRAWRHPLGSRALYSQ